jgi:hypothetical protein
VADKAVFSIAKSETQAIVIADNLRAAGFRANAISVLLPDKAATRDFAHEQHTKAPEAQLRAERAERYWAVLWAGWLESVFGHSWSGAFHRSGPYYGCAGWSSRCRNCRWNNWSAHRLGYSRV